ncbi:MAG: hypothetical protein GF331_13830 [Chitinivibrionales bacterium]|nr:hypothetical protein [Chitinivibrionales bacterium]
MHDSEKANAYPWINPIGGLGDMLMLSGVLKLAYDADPECRYNLVRRTEYQSIFNGHPAIATVGYLPPGAQMKGVTYCSMEQVGPGEQRPFQILARAFGLKTPVEEQVYLPGEIADDPVLFGLIPWRERTVVICPTSATPRKEMPRAHWEEVVRRLTESGALVLQVGKARDRRIHGAYSLCGLTTPQQLVALLRRTSAVATADNFVMHAAHLTGTPTVVTWGPTDHEVYGYADQVHLQPPRDCPERSQCMGPGRGGDAYGEPCPRDQHCTAAVSPDDVYEATVTLLKKQAGAAAP